MTTANNTSKPILPLPSTERILRGLRSALSDLDTSDRPDLQHATTVMDTVLSHLLLREDRSPYPAIYTALRQLIEKVKAIGPLADAMTQALAILPASLDSEQSFDRIQAIIGEALSCLSDALHSGQLPEHLKLQALQLEQQFYGANYRHPPQNDVAVPPQISQEKFEPYLLAQFPGQYRGIKKFQRLAGGFQKETILFDAERADGGIEEMVIRAEKHDRFVRLTASEITEEYAIVSLAFQRGIKVAEPLWLEDDAGKLGWRFMVSRRAAGRNTGDSQGTSAAFSDALTRSYVETLASIHLLKQDDAVAATTLGQWLKYPELGKNTAQEVTLWRHQIWMQNAPASPAFARIFDWLEANAPEDEAPICVLHNDYGPHNTLVENEAVSAVLDWEVARIGDPAEDLSFFLQCCGQAIDSEKALAMYQEITGFNVSEYRLRYYDVMSCAKVLLSGLSASSMYQQTEPALLDWIQMPALWFGAYLPQVEEKIAAAEAVRQQK